MLLGGISKNVGPENLCNQVLAKEPWIVPQTALAQVLENPLGLVRRWLLGQFQWQGRRCACEMDRPIEAATQDACRNVQVRTFRECFDNPLSVFWDGTKTARLRQSCHQSFMFLHARLAEFTTHHQDFFRMIRRDIQARRGAPAETPEGRRCIPRLADAIAVEVAGP